MKNNAAYDMSRFASEPEKRSAVRVVKTGKRKSVKTAGRYKVVLLSLLVASLMVMTLFSRTELNETKNRINRLNSQLVELESQNAYLNYKLESSVSLKYAEDYAASELGLIKVDSSRINYVNLNNENMIVSERSGETNLFKSCLEGVMDFISD